jgi:DNA-directed RNA polymerase subunit RPC12/RpoP
MSYLKERVSYLKGLAEGMKLDDSNNEGILLKAIIEVMDEIASEVDKVEELQEQLSEQVDTIDEDLGEIEGIIFDEEGEKDIFDGKIECPFCKEEIDIDFDMIDDETDTIECPNCNKKIEIDWDCDCEDCNIIEDSKE